MLWVDVVAVSALHETAHFEHDDLDPACAALRAEVHDRGSPRRVALANLSDHRLVCLRERLVPGHVHCPVRGHHDRAPLGLGVRNHRGQVPESRCVAHESLTESLMILLREVWWAERDLHSQTLRFKWSRFASLRTRPRVEPSRCA